MHCWWVGKKAKYQLNLLSILKNLLSQLRKHKSISTSGVEATKQWKDLEKQIINTGTITNLPCHYYRVFPPKVLPAEEWKFCLSPHSKYVGTCHSYKDVGAGKERLMRWIENKRISANSIKFTFGSSCWWRIDDVFHPTMSFNRVKFIEVSG